MSKLTPIDLECNMGKDINGIEHREPWKAYDIDEVDALLAKKDEKIRRLQRALYKACANWARAERKPLENWGCYKEAQRWLNMEHEGLKKAEELK